jgi:hypothetical protein
MRLKKFLSLSGKLASDWLRLSVLAAYSFIRQIERSETRNTQLEKSALLHH